MSSGSRISPPKAAPFRPEIEGLRAVAATLVAVFHIWMHRPSGAVDVFFVVSGFLITTGLLGQVERLGRVEFARFWARLIKRLLPVALFVLLAIIATSFFLLPQSRWKETIIEVAASAVYLENWRQAQGETGSPVLHYWALSMQGQFYLLWPFLIGLAAVLARRSGVAFRRMVTILLAVILGASFAYSIVLTGKDQPFAYFNTFARIWEFCIGALLATWISRLELPAPLRVLAGWLGLAAIVSCGLVLEVAGTFPGYAALWPTLGGALVIVAGSSGSAFGADRFLASRPMVFLGGISYGIYLWHFPVLIFTNLVRAPEPIGLLSGSAILVASVVLAYGTNRLLENPTRYSAVGKERPARAFALGAAAMVPVAIALALWTYAFVHARDQAQTSITLPDPDYPGAMALEPGFTGTGHREVAVYPGPFVAGDDHEYQWGGNCERQARTPKGCSLGARDGSLTLAVVGGAHSAQWLPALRDIALRSGWKLISFTRTNCPFHFGDSVLEYEIATCRTWNEGVIEALRQLKPDVIFTTSTLLAHRVETVPASYVEAWERLVPLGSTVVALRDNPRPDFDVSACVELHGAAGCALPRAALLASRSPVESLAHPPPNVRFLDLSDYFCGREWCEAVVGNVLVYRKLHQLTATYVRTMTPILERELRRALARKG